MDSQELLTQLNWRYATKRFDPERLIPTNILRSLEESLRLSTSAFGLQPWKFLVITNSEIRKELKLHSWNQEQITEASHLIVFVAKESIDPIYIGNFINLLARRREQPLSTLDGYKIMMERYFANLPDHLAWSREQTYIALGHFLTALAVLKIDSCPIAGLVPDSYDKILHLIGSGYKTVCACPIGYRHPEDKYATLPKVRFSSSEIVFHIE